MVGSELTLRGPQGVFVLPEVIDRDLFLICTGTGVAPFRSMVHHIHSTTYRIKTSTLFLVPVTSTIACTKTSWSSCHRIE